MTAPVSPQDPNQPDEDLAHVIFSRGGAIPAIGFSLFALFWMPGALGIDQETQAALALCLPLASGPLLMTVAGFTWSIVTRSQPVALATSLWAILTAAPFVGWLGHALFGKVFVTLAFVFLLTPLLGFLLIVLPIMRLTPSPRPTTNRLRSAGHPPGAGTVNRVPEPPQQSPVQDPDNRG